jgi:hypothetical protein
LLCFFFLAGDLAAGGSKYCDVLEGKGAVAEKGMTVQVYLWQTKIVFICFCISKLFLKKFKNFLFFFYFKLIFFWCF